MKKENDDFSFQSFEDASTPTAPLPFLINHTILKPPITDTVEVVIKSKRKRKRKSFKNRKNKSFKKKIRT